MAAGAQASQARPGLNGAAVVEAQESSRQLVGFAIIEIALPVEIAPNAGKLYAYS
jgi:hypothetical protein